MHLGLLEVLDGAEVSGASQKLDCAVGAVDCGVDEVNGVLMRFDCVLDALGLFGRLLCGLCFWFGCGCGSMCCAGNCVLGHLGFLWLRGVLWFRCLCWFGHGVMWFVVGCLLWFEGIVKGDLV